MNFLFHFR